MTAVRFPDRTKLVVYASENGVPMNASLSDPTVGTDASTALQSLVDSVYNAGGGTVIIDGICKCHDIKLRSGVTIQGVGTPTFDMVSRTFPSTGIMQSPRSQCVFRNYHWTSNYNNGTPVSDYSTVVDRDITIRNLFVNGNRGVGSVNNASGGNSDIRTNGLPDEWNNPALLWISPFIFFGVRNLRLENVYSYDPSTFNFYMAYIDGAYIVNVTVFDPVVAGVATAPAAIRNTDGVHFIGPARNITIDGVWGYTADDFLALNANDSNGGSNQYYPIQYTGDITNVVARRLYPQNSLATVAMRSGAAIGTSLIDDVVIRDVVGFNHSRPFRIINNGGGSANYGRITFENLFLDVATGTSGFIDFNGNIKQLTFRKVHLNLTASAPGGGLAAFSMQIKPADSSAVVDMLVLDEFLINDARAAVGTLVVMNAGTVRKLRIQNLTWIWAGTPGGALVSVSGGTVDSIQLSNVLLDQISNAITYTSGTLSSVTCVGLTHLNAGGSPSISVGAGRTLPRLRASGSNTLLLTSGGGTITSKRTDATEDA